ncbi:hypothetical protein J437_LFUL004573 [Ladona fulva]|uniref:Uncharacterized protein n=1 Tax=Ladona fulva TaxID=123851 RepID=A0A8K0JVB6_LADFU|nr:hypothetical protein J437_LFUL004573 [Ladona fulva]
MEIGNATGGSPICEADQLCLSLPPSAPFSFSPSTPLTLFRPPRPLSPIFSVGSLHPRDPFRTLFLWHFPGDPRFFIPSSRRFSPLRGSLATSAAVEHNLPRRKDLLSPSYSSPLYSAIPFRKIARPRSFFTCSNSTAVGGESIPKHEQGFPRFSSPPHPTSSLSSRRGKNSSNLDRFQWSISRLQLYPEGDPLVEKLLKDMATLPIKKVALTNLYEIFLCLELQVTEPGKISIFLCPLYPFTLLHIIWYCSKR